MDYEISVIIPVWNLDKYISKCLDSAFNQTFKGSYEVLVCLGESYDKTEAIVRDCMKEHENLRIVQCGGEAIMNLRLKGVQAAKGKYIAFLDADDFYEPTYLEVMHNEISKGYDVVNCAFYINKGSHVSKTIFSKNKELDSVGACNALLSDTYMRAYIWSKVFKRELFDMSKLVLPKSKEHFFEDTTFIFEIFTRVKKVKSIKTPLYHYVYNPKSITKSENPNRFNYHLSTFLVIKLLCEKSNNNKLYRVFRKKLLRCKVSLFFDAYVSRHVTGNSMCKEYRLHKVGIRTLKSKKPTNLDNYEWKQYVLDCLKPLQ